MYFIFNFSHATYYDFHLYIFRHNIKQAWMYNVTRLTDHLLIKRKIHKVTCATVSVLFL